MRSPAGGAQACAVTKEMATASPVTTREGLAATLDLLVFLKIGPGFAPYLPLRFKGGCHGVHQVHFRPSTVLPYGSCSHNRAS